VVLGGIVAAIVGLSGPDISPGTPSHTPSTRATAPGK
jgi:hypothetical protein